MGRKKADPIWKLMDGLPKDAAGVIFYEDGTISLMIPKRKEDEEVTESEWRVGLVAMLFSGQADDLLDLVSERFKRLQEVH